MPRRRRIFRTAAAAQAAALLLYAGVAGAQFAPANQLKAALIYNLMLFTEWPAAAMAENAPLTLCLLKASPTALALAQLEQKSVAGHPLRVRQLNEGDSGLECKVIYLEKGEQARSLQIRKKLEGLSVLTISDRPDAIDEGAMIAIGEENNRLIFDINASAARQARLTISSKLLRLARKVL